MVLSETNRLQFPESFFQEEDRGGFVVPAKMKRSWAVQLQVLSLIAEICARHRLSWWADFGTLLGAVRHRGFIPWDDDIDIALPRADYMRLMKLLPYELPPFCKTWSLELDPHYQMLSSFVANRREIDVGESEEEASITAYYFDCPYVAGVDVYPLDYVPADGEQYDAWVELLGIVYYAAHAYHKAQAAGELPELLERIEEAAGTQLPRGEETRSALWRLAEQLSMIWGNEEAVGLVWTSELVTCASPRVRPLDAYERTILLPFENLMIPVPVGYASVLTIRFGAWGAAQQAGSAHDYPFYRKQDAYIAQRSSEAARRNG